MCKYAREEVDKSIVTRMNKEINGLHIELNTNNTFHTRGIYNRIIKNIQVHCCCQGSYIYIF